VIGMIGYDIQTQVLSLYTPDFTGFTDIAANFDQAIEFIAKFEEYPDAFLEVLMDSCTFSEVS